MYLFSQNWEYQTINMLFFIKKKISPYCWRKSPYKEGELGNCFALTMFREITSVELLLHRQKNLLNLNLSTSWVFFSMEIQNTVSIVTASWTYLTNLGRNVKYICIKRYINDRKVYCFHSSKNIYLGKLEYISCNVF